MSDKAAGDAPLAANSDLLGRGFKRARMRDGCRYSGVVSGLADRIQCVDWRLGKRSCAFAVARASDSVVSTNRHTVKPWFAGRAEVSPAVAYLESQGYSLAGGRADVLWGQRAAVTVYRHGAHTINIFSWAAAGELLNKNVTRNGCHLDFWNVGNVQSSAVSDIGWNEMQGLVNMQRQLAPHEDHPTTE